MEIHLCNYQGETLQTITVNSSTSHYATEIAHVKNQIENTAKQANDPAMRWQDSIDNHFLLDECRRQIGKCQDALDITISY